MEFYYLNDTVNNISGGNIETYYDKTEEYNENKTLVSIERIDDSKPPVFTGGIKLFEISINKINSLLLGKDVDIYNSLSIRRKPDSKIGQFSTAMGFMVEASHYFSHAEGERTISSGIGSHAEGAGTTASGGHSHAEGSGTTASNFNSHAEGAGTTASGFNSHAEGESTVASGQSQHVQGKYNIEDKANKYAHIVGNGASDSKRANAHTVDWGGNAWYAGKLSQEGTPTEDKDLTTKKYVDNMKTDIDNIKTELGTGTLSTASQDLKGAINEVFQNASNGKALIAQAITGKGINATSNDTWQELATKISQL